MLRLSVYNESVKENGEAIPVYRFETYSKVNILCGDSGSGKSVFIDNVSDAVEHIDQWYLECNLPIELLQGASKLGDIHNSLVIMDEAASESMLASHRADKLARSDNYYILCDRSLVGKIATNVNAVFKIESTGKVISGIPIFNISNLFGISHVSNVADCKDKVKYCVTEDSVSGMIFWSKVLRKLEYYIPDNKEMLGGNSNIRNVLVELLGKTSNECMVLVGLDYDQGSLDMFKILDDKCIDSSRLVFIRMECFEEVICNSEFILGAFPEMRDKVINYREYIGLDCKHTGKYFGKLLFEYVKQKPPIETKSKRNVEKFYTKGAKYFEQCFIDDCCKFSKGSKECKLYYSGNKNEVLLCNKFEQLRVFMEVHL